MQLAKGSDSRVVDVEVDDIGCNSQVESCINAVSKCDQIPSRPESLQFFSPLAMLGCININFLGPRYSSLGLLSSYKLDDVGDKKMTGNEEVEDATIHNILSAIIVAADTDQNTILLESASCSIARSDQLYPPF